MRTYIRADLQTVSFIPHIFALVVLVLERQVGSWKGNYFLQFVPMFFFVVVFFDKVTVDG